MHLSQVQQLPHFPQISWICYLSTYWTTPCMVKSSRSRFSPWSSCAGGWTLGSPVVWGSPGGERVSSEMHSSGHHKVRGLVGLSGASWAPRQGGGTPGPAPDMQSQTAMATSQVQHLFATGDSERGPRVHRWFSSFTTESFRLGRFDVNFVSSCLITPKPQPSWSLGVLLQQISRALWFDSSGQGFCLSVYLIVMEKEWKQPGRAQHC